MMWAILLELAQVDVMPFLEYDEALRIVFGVQFTPQQNQKSLRVTV